MSTGGYPVDFDAIKRTVSMEKVLGLLSVTGLKQKAPVDGKASAPSARAASTATAIPSMS